MIKIPLKQTPSQTFKIKLGAQNCEFRIYYRFGNTYMDLTVNGEVIQQGAICRDRENIIQIAQTTFKGDLFFADMLGDSDPHYSRFGERWKLFFRAVDGT